jgi:hypothetical protein
MPYIARNLVSVGGEHSGTSVITSGVARRAPMQFTYGTSDSITTCRASGYFNNAANLLRKGDLVTITSYSGADFETNAAVTVSGYQNMVVLTSVNGVVDLSDGSSIGLTNT